MSKRAKKGTKSYYHKKLGGKQGVFKRYIRLRAGKCEARGELKGKFAKCGGILHCSHVKSVGAYPSIKYDPVNAIGLCWRHHMEWWHKEPTESAAWFERKYPARSSYLEHEKNRVWKPTADDLKEMFEMYRDKCKELEK